MEARTHLRRLSDDTKKGDDAHARPRRMQNANERSCIDAALVHPRQTWTAEVLRSKTPLIPMAIVRETSLPAPCPRRISCAHLLPQLLPQRTLAFATSSTPLRAPGGSTFGQIANPSTCNGAAGEGGSHLLVCTGGSAYFTSLRGEATAAARLRVLWRRWRQNTYSQTSG